MMKLPKQTPAIKRDQTITVIAVKKGAIVPQGCCVRVAGVCIMSSPIF